jgi:hypothetical protein
MINMNRSAKLISDDAYITAHEKQSKFPFEYHTALVPNEISKEFSRKCTSVPGNCKQFHVTGQTVDSYNTKIIATATRPQPRPQTEVFGLPFKARGDGILRDTDTLSKLQYSGFNPTCVKPLSEVDFDRWECIGAKLEVEDPHRGPRGGMSTRTGAQYFHPACM